MAEDTLGDRVRRGRVASEIGVRALAADLGVSPSYISDIENDRRVPSEEVLRALSTRLELDFDELMALAGRFGDDAERYMRRTPAVGLLFRRLHQEGYSDAKVREIISRLDDSSSEPS